MIGYLFRNLISGSALQRTLRSHFEGLALAEIVTAARDFPITSRVDLQAALDEKLANRSGTPRCLPGEPDINFLCRRDPALEVH